MSVLRDLEPVFILTWSPVRICCGGDAVVMNRGSRGRRPLFICGRWKQFAWSLRGIQCALYFLFSSLFCFISQPIFSTPRFDQRLTVACHGRGPPRTVLDYLSVRDCGLLIVILSVDLFSTLVCLCLFSFFFIHES